MAQFPVAYSALSQTHLAQLVRDQYGYSDQTHCTLLKSGIAHTYLITDGEQKAVLRVYFYQWRSKEAIAEELRLIDLLRQSGLAVSYALPALSAELIQEINAPEGLRYAVLFSFAEGSKIREHSPVMAAKIGSYLGQMHQVTEGLELARERYDTQRLLHDSAAWFRPYFDEQSEEMQWVARASRQIEKSFGHANQQQIRRGAVHMDVWYDNFNIQEEKITLFDFDFCGNGWLLLDVAYAMKQLWLTTPDKALAADNLKAFMQGYEQHCTLHEAERTLIPLAGTAIWIFYLGIQAQRYEDWSNVFYQAPHYLPRFLGMSRDWLKHFELEV